MTGLCLLERPDTEVFGNVRRIADVGLAERIYIVVAVSFCVAWHDDC